MPNMAIAEENQLSVYNWQYKTNNLIIETKRIVNEKKAKRRINWYRSPVEAADLARLNQRSDWRGMVQTLAYLAVLVCSGGLAWFAVGRAHWLVVIALIYLHGALHAFMVNGFHELCHKTVFKTGALNIFFRNVYSFLGWYSHVSFWASHQAHHRYTLHPPDDSEVLLPVDLTLKSYLRFAFVNPRGLYLRLKQVLQLCFGIIENDWELALFPPENADGRRALFNWARILIIGHGLIVLFSLLTGWWMLAVLVTLAPFYGGGFQYLLNVAQHIGMTDEVSDYRINTRTLLLNPVLAFLYWQMNYHIEHHMYAAVPFYHLAELHRLIRDDLPECPRGVTGTWAQIIPILRRQQREPDYQFLPELP